jgi:hypothetical protein
LLRACCDTGSIFADTGDPSISDIPAAGNADIRGVADILAAAGI